MPSREPGRGPLYVSRKFPPVVGGMEILAEQVWSTLRTAHPDARLIANARGNRHLLWWLPAASALAFWHLLRRRVSVLVAGDPITLVVCVVWARLFRVPTRVVVHGLDLTWGPGIYRRIVLAAVKAADGSIAISGATADAAVAIGVDRAKIVVIPPGLAVPAPVGDKHDAHRSLTGSLGLTDSDVVLTTVGRLVERKGVAWFVRNVMPRLAPNVHYAVAGTGIHLDAITAAIDASGTASRVHLLGRVDGPDWEALMRGADLFVQPNVKVAGDMEGFGLVTVEAAMRGTYVVASAMEGIIDAVIDGVTGTLVASEDTDAWVHTIDDLVADRAHLVERSARAAERSRTVYGEATFSAALLAELERDTGR